MAVETPADGPGRRHSASWSPRSPTAGGYHGDGDRSHVAAIDLRPRAAGDPGSDLGDQGNGDRGSRAPVALLGARRTERPGGEVRLSPDARPPPTISGWREALTRGWVRTPDEVLAKAVRKPRATNESGHSWRLNAHVDQGIDDRRAG
jgi:hypothetical protein